MNEITYYTDPDATPPPVATPPQRRPHNGAETILMIIAILYIVSPVDALPDVLPVIGQVDDVLMIVLALWARGGLR